MIDYLKAAKEHEITFAEAYIRTQNAIVKQTAIPHPSSKDFKKFELLQKQLKDITAAITEECVKQEGYERNPKTYLWERRSPVPPQN